MKKTFIGILASIMTLGQGFTHIYANENTFSDNKNKELLQIAEDSDIEKVAKDNQRIDIEENAYETYNQSKMSFQKLQAQYGDLSDDSHTNSKFQSYLKTIQKDEENSNLESEINKMGDGDYSVNISNTTYMSLQNELKESTDEEKQEMLEKQESAINDEVQKAIEEDNDRNSTFGESYNEQNKTMKDEFNEKVKENNEKVEEETSSQIKEFGKLQEDSKNTIQKEQEAAKAESERNKNNILNQNKEQTNKNTQNANAFKESGKKNGESIVKNYKILRDAILNAQKAMNAKKK